MIPRLLALGITLFWLTMNFLLWRFETRGQGGAEVPWQTVAQRVLEAAESSNLFLRHHGEPMGQLRWTPTVLEDVGSKRSQLTEDGMVTARTGYAIDFDLTLNPNLKLHPGSTVFRGRGHGHCEFNLDRSWRSLEVRFFQRPWAYELSAHATNSVLQFRMLDGTHTLFSQTLPFNDPAALTTQFAGLIGGFDGGASGLISTLGAMGAMIPTLSVGRSNLRTNANLEGIFHFDARSDELRIGRQRVRAYHMTGKLFNQYRGEFWIGRGGEILRGTLPDEIELSDQNLPLLRQ